MISWCRPSRNSRSSTHTLKILFQLGSTAGTYEYGGDGFLLQDPEYQIVTHDVLGELAFGMENLGLDMVEK